MTDSTSLHATPDEAPASARPVSDAVSPQSLARPTTVSPRINWVYTVALVGMHVLALMAVVPWLFSWTGLILCVVGVFAFGQGINLCYHRLLTHRSFAVPRWLERCLVIVALCCMEDTPCKWVTTHRHHHKHSDEQEDPHTPLAGLFWSHFQWLTHHNSGTHGIGAFNKYSKDILADPFYMAMEKNMWISPLIYLAHAVLYAAAGFVAGWLMHDSLMAGVQFGLSLLVWGVILRTVLVWHITWSVNSLTHVWGYRNHETSEQSRNNWLVGLLAVGEGWHNNHHYDQASACNQHRWWEVDATWYCIKVLSWLGLAKKIVPPKHIRDAKNEARRAHDGR
jgi:stearoyl-CoA desaturase (delta-9 desaturase)